MPTSPGLLPAAPKCSQASCVAAGEGHKAAKKRVRQEKIAGVSKVVGVSKLRTKYEPFEAKRTLCNSFDLFVADDRVIPSLPKLLGEAWTLCSIQAHSCGHLCLCRVLVPLTAAAVPGACLACCCGALAVKSDWDSSPMQSWWPCSHARCTCRQALLQEEEVANSCGPDLQGLGCPDTEGSQRDIPAQGPGLHTQHQVPAPEAMQQHDACVSCEACVCNSGHLGTGKDTSGAGHRQIDASVIQIAATEADRNLQGRADVYDT